MVCFLGPCLEPIIGHLQARSQDLEKGGLFWKSEKCANDLDSNFHWSWINFRRFVRNLRRNVSESSEIQSFFPPKIRWSPKKKKKKKVFSKIQSDFLAEIQSFFPPKIRWSPKKKKGLRQNWDCYFVQFRKFRRLRGAVFEWVGLFSIFHRKSASKAQKPCDFAYFTSQWGGSSPPRPPLATLLATCVISDLALFSRKCRL